MTDYHALEEELTKFLEKHDDVELLESIFNVTAKMIREKQHLTNKPIEYTEDKNNENR